jgi:hypothetical protein
MLLCGTLLLSLTKYTSYYRATKRGIYNNSVFKDYWKRLLNAMDLVLPLAGHLVTYKNQNNNCSWLLSMINRKSN